MCEDDNDPSQMLDSHLGPSSELVARRLPVPRRQLFHSTTAKGGEETVGQAGGSGSGKSLAMAKPPLAQSPITFALLETGTSTCSTVNFHKAGKPKRAAGYWKRRQLRFINGC